MSDTQKTMLAMAVIVACFLIGQLTGPTELDAVADMADEVAALTGGDK